MEVEQFYAYLTIGVLIVLSVMINAKNIFKKNQDFTKKPIIDNEHINMLPSLEQEDFGYTDSFK